MEIYWALGASLLIGLWMTIIYRRLSQTQVGLLDSFTHLEVQLKKRYDLIPQIAQAAKKEMLQEKETLEAIMSARNHAMAAAQRVSSDPLDAQALMDLLGAEALLEGTLEQFYLTASRYTDLDRQEDLSELKQRLMDADRKILSLKSDYNENVRSYNQRIGAFPDRLLAGAFNFVPGRQWQQDPE